MKALVAATIAAALAFAVPAGASEESEALDSRGAVLLHEGKLDQARALFEQAVAADPQDPVPLYHRGVVHTREKQYDEAIADFREALRLEPRFDEAALELGIALVESGRAPEARSWLEQAKTKPALEGQAAFFLGIADLREERYEQARAAFELARAKDPTLEVTSRYYLGVVDYRSGEAVSAREHFAFVQQQSPDTAVGREASSFLELIRAGEATGTQLYGSLTFEYDTNVILAPAEGLPQQAISDQSDGRVTINAGGVYEVWRGDRARFTVGYDFYQNVQFELSEYDITDNRPSMALTGDIGPFRAGTFVFYDYYLLDFSNFLQQVTVQPWLVYPQTDDARAEIYLRYEWRDYLDSTYEILDGNYILGGLRQVFGLGEDRGEVWAGFEAATQDPTEPGGDLYAYDAVQGEIALLWNLPWQIESQAAYRFRYESYDQASSVFLPVGDPRLDREHRVGIAFRRPINELISVVAAWIGTWNDSNKDVFDYTRQIGSIGVEVRY